MMILFSYPNLNRMSIKFSLNILDLDQQKILNLTQIISMLIFCNSINLFNLFVSCSS